MATLNIQNVRKSYSAAHVIHGVDIEIADGEFVILVGPSGCGKSTLLRMIAGLEEITSGVIAIDGRVVNGLEPKDRDIAMVFQNYALYPQMSVSQNMSFALEMAGAKRNEIQQKVGRAADILGLTPFLDRKPAQLSGGQRQRVAMGRAIVRDPKVFLFDEPLSNLDAKLRVKMRAEIKALHQRLKTTIVYVTHDQIEAMTMADKIVVMQGGRVEQIGTPLELYDRPNNLFVAGFLGSPAMNFLEGRMEGGNGPLLRMNDGTLVPLGNAPVVADGAEIVVGIRPEDIRFAEREAGVSAIVKVVEPTGSETHVELDIAGTSATWLLRQRAHLIPDERVELSFENANAHFFDKTSGARI